MTNRSLVLVSGDLLLQSQISASTAAVGVDLRTSSVASLNPSLFDESVIAVAIDLAASGSNLASVVDTCRGLAGANCEIWAFGPHVQTERLAAARMLGCDWVTSRGDFVQRAAERCRALSG
jgi:hypothetical protein